MVIQGGFGGKGRDIVVDFGGPAPAAVPNTLPPHKPVPIDEALVDRVMHEAQAAMQRVAEEHGLKLVPQTCNYSVFNVRLKFELCSRSPRGVVMDGAAESFLKQATRFNLRPSDLGREFDLSGFGRVRIIGLRPRAKENVLCELVKDPRRQVVLDAYRVYKILYL